jgi:hypothetical protein
MATPKPPVILPPFNDATARLNHAFLERKWQREHPIAAFEPGIALP